MPAPITADDGAQLPDCADSQPVRNARHLRVLSSLVGCHLDHPVRAFRDGIRSEFGVDPTGIPRRYQHEADHADQRDHAAVSGGAEGGPGNIPTEKSLPKLTPRSPEGSCLSGIRNTRVRSKSGHVVSRCLREANLLRGRLPRRVHLCARQRPIDTTDERGHGWPNRHVIFYTPESYYCQTTFRPGIILPTTRPHT